MFIQCASDGSAFGTNTFGREKDVEIFIKDHKKGLLPDSKKKIYYQE